MQDQDVDPGFCGERFEGDDHSDAQAISRFGLLDSTQRSGLREFFKWLVCISSAQQVKVEMKDILAPAPFGVDAEPVSASIDPLLPGDFAGAE